MMSRKISIIGAGMTGASAALWLAESRIADLLIVDVVEGLAQGKALDLLETLALRGNSVHVTGSNDYAATHGSDIIIIAAGIPRRPGMSREDLLATNAQIVKEVTKSTLAHSPEAIYIILTNPLDTMAYLVLKTAGLPRHRVIGQAGVLDSARMRAFVAMETGISVENIQCYVMGGHGDEMVPLVRHSNIAGIPLVDFLPAERLDAIVERTRKGGSEIVNLLKSGSAYVAPGAAVAQMVDAILNDQHRILPASVLVQGEYGLEDIFFGVPVRLGKSGLEKVVDYHLDEVESAGVERSARVVRESKKVLERLGFV